MRAKGQLELLEGWKLPERRHVVSDDANHVSSCFQRTLFFLRKSDYSYLPAFLRASSNCCVSEAFGQIKSQLQTVLTLTPPPSISIHWHCFVTEHVVSTFVLTFLYYFLLSNTLTSSHKDDR